MTLKNNRTYIKLFLFISYAVKVRYVNCKCGYLEHLLSVYAETKGLATHSLVGIMLIIIIPALKLILS